MSAITEVVSALVDAAFTTGGITDAQQADLHAKLDGADQPAAPEAPPAEAAPDSAAPVAPEFGSESTPYA